LSEVDGVDEVDAPQRSPRPPLTPAQRRARRQTVTLLIVCGLLLVSFLFAAAYYGGWFDSPKDKAGGPTCTPTAPPSKVKPSQVKVNVYNASTRNGLARKVAGEMRLRGFTVGTIANDPLHRTVRTSAEVRYGAKGKAGAQLVSSEVAGSKLVADKRTDASVDLVLGGTYSELTETPSSGSSASSSCSPTSTGTGTGTRTTAPKATSTSTKK
jgi:hypothetical protein